MVKYATISCPLCGTAITLRIYFRLFGRFSCHVCGAKGFGPVFKQGKKQMQDRDIIADVRDKK
ncbi:MAG: hypothetical protein PHS57_06205 [Alphaproteobacteria bacterium]|nr:hypothetical protein [Alphaproteobacteria bacterium]